jgi:hypothetical protein
VSELSLRKGQLNQLCDTELFGCEL